MKQRKLKEARIRQKKIKPKGGRVIKLQPNFHRSQETSFDRKRIVKLIFQFREVLLEG
ncbi:MAG: hypothetical protein QXL24_05100 [Candidatus Jordarchaeaceae archaeon]